VFSRFVELVPLKDQMAHSIKRALVSGWFLRHGIPEALLSDQAHNMDGNVVRQLCDDLKIAKLRSSPHHPEGDGMAERMIGSAKAKFRLLLADRQMNTCEWPEVLAEVTFALNSTVSESTKVSAHEVFYGQRLRSMTDATIGLAAMPGASNPEAAVASVRAAVDSFSDTVKTNQRESRLRQKALYDKRAKPVPSEITVGHHVMIDNRYRRSGLDPVFVGPYAVIARRGPNITVEDDSGRRKTVHLNRCKPYARPMPLPPITSIAEFSLAGEAIFTDAPPAEPEPAEREPDPSLRRSSRIRKPTQLEDYVYY
jgi:hypothetical protein